MRQHVEGKHLTKVWQARNRTGLHIIISGLFGYLRLMAKWLLILSVFIGNIGCQSETATDSPKSGTIVPTKGSAVPLIFLQKEMTILNIENPISIRDTALFRSLPPGVYPIHSDTILFGKPSSNWISSGITRWPSTGRIALAETIITDKPLLTHKIGIFPQKPRKDGYLPGCFSCPDWITKQYGGLAIFWEKYSK